MSRIEFNEAALAQVVNDAAQYRMAQLQVVYDRVLEAGRGKSLEEVKELLRSDIRTTFGTEMVDPELTACSQELVSGRRIEVRGS